MVWLGQSFKGRIACVGPLPSLILPPFCLTWVAPRQLEEQDVSFYHPTFSLNLSLLFLSGLVVIHDTLCGIHSECDGTQNNTDIGVLHRWKAMDKGQNFRKDSCTYTQSVLLKKVTHTFELAHLWTSFQSCFASVLVFLPPSVYCNIGKSPQ